MEPHCDIGGRYVIGFDYGVRPRMMLLGDIEFPQLMSDGLKALGYGQCPGWGPLLKVPLLTLIFSSTAKARQCFSHFLRWSRKEKDGDAVGMSFVEFDSGDYGLCVYPDHEHLVDRLLPIHLRDEVDPLAAAASHMKVFPHRSQHYLSFKNKVKSSPFVIAPGTVQGPMLDLALRKKAIAFHAEHGVADDSMEAALLRSRTQKKQRGPAVDAASTAAEIAQRRKAQLSRFFPVSSEVMISRSDYSGAKQELLGVGYHEWQLQQAACNLIAQSRLRDARNESTNQVDFLEHLLCTAETISSPLPSEGSLSTEHVKAQIHADAQYLIEHVDAPRKPHLSKDIINELQRRNLLS